MADAAEQAKLLRADCTLAIGGGSTIGLAKAFSLKYACDVVLYTEFTDTAALTHYATHAEHMRVRDELEGLRISRHQVDYLSDNAVERA